MFAFFDVKTPAAIRARRFLSVTVVTALVGQLSILGLHSGLGVSPLMANGLAVLLVTAVGFALSTKFVWPSDPERRYRIEVPAFLTLSVIGLVTSTVVIAAFVQVSDHPLAVNAGSAFSYGLVWIGRFLLLDRYIFAEPPLVPESAGH